MALFGKESERDRQRAQEYAQWMQAQNPLAVASLVLGIFSFIEMGVLIVFGVGGIVLGAMALKQLRQPDPKPPRGHGLAWAGIITSLISLAVATGLYLYPLVRS